jgi:hypothetical protein
LFDGARGAVEYFQAGHASSILVTRSMAKLVTRSMAKALVGGSLSTLIRTRPALYCGRRATYGPLRGGFALTPDLIGLARPAGAVLSRSHKSQKSFIVSVLSPGAPASPRQPWTPHRPTSQLPSAHRTSQDEANRPSSSRADHHRCQPERVHIAAESSPRTPLGHAPIPALQSAQPQQLIPRQSALEECVHRGVNTRSRPAIDRVPAKIVLSGTSMSASSGVVEGPARAKETPFAAFWNM